MEYNYRRLKGKIKEVFGTQERFANAMGMGLSTLNLKLNNNAEWTQEEMVKAMDLLGEEIHSVQGYFFAHGV